jgi:hypothetical protein
MNLARPDRLEFGVRFLKRANRISHERMRQPAKLNLQAESLACASM